MSILVFVRSHLPFFSCLGLLLFILTPIILYYCFQFWKLRDRQFFKQRHPYLVLSIVIGLHIWLCIYVPFVWTLKSTLSSSENLKYISHVVRELGFCFLSSILIRFWRLYFDYTRALQIKAMKWHKNITQQSTQHMPWTLKYSFLNDSRFLASLVVIFSLIAGILMELFCSLFSFMYKNIPSLYVL